MPTEQILGRYWWQIVHPADEQTVQDTFMHIIQVSDNLSSDVF